MSDKLQLIIDKLPFKLSSEQDFFVRDYINGTGHAFLLGDQGTGKTTVMQILAEYYKDEIIFCGSSGIATVNLPNNIGYCTGHRLFNLTVGRAIDKDRKRSAARILTSSDMVKIIVVDEAFCYDSQNLNQIMMQINKLNKATRNRKARNIRLLLVGDVLQRLPIVSSDPKDLYNKDYLNETYGSWLMFESWLWNKLNPTPYVFTESKRISGTSPKDVWFRKALYVLRYGLKEHYPIVIKGLNKLVVGENYKQGSVYIAPTNRAVDEYNRQYLLKNTNPKVTFKAHFGDKYDKKDFPMETEVTLAVGASVICLVNDPEGYYQNGTELTITSILDGEGVYGVKPNGEEVYVPLYEFKQDEIVAVPKPVSDLSVEDMIGKLIECGKVVEDEDQVKKGVIIHEEALSLTRLQLENKYTKGVKDENKILMQDRVTIDTAYMLPVKLCAGFVSARVQGRTFNRAGVIDVGEPENDYWYHWKKMEDFGTATLSVSLGRFTSLDHIQLYREVKPCHIKVHQPSIDFWNKSLRKFKERK